MSCIPEDQKIREELLDEYSDLYKEVHGFRPRDLDKFTSEQQILDALQSLYEDLKNIERYESGELNVRPW